MGTNDHNQITLNEMVFENRNKNYGAYILRREYDLALIKSFGLSMLILMSLGLFYRLIPVAIPEKPLPAETVIWVDRKINITVPEKQIIKPIIKVAQTDRITPNSDIPEVVETVVKKDPTKENPEIAPAQDYPGEGYTENSGTEGDHPPTETLVTAEPEKYAEVMPEYPGGEKALIEFLKNNIHYPREAIRNEISGTVVMRFVVDTDGSINHIEFIRKIGGGCEAEAQRVVENMPRWKPGRMKGRAVPVYFCLPVSYQLQR